MTALSQKEWSENIISVVRHFADREYQRKAWLEEGGPVSSPIEMYNELYDDALFERYFDQYGASFTEAQRSAWLNMDEALEKYGERLEGSVDPKEIMDDPEWSQVRSAAERFLQAFDNN